MSYQTHDSATSATSRSLVSWWYSIAAPPEPPATSPLAQRELARRGRVTSLIMLVAWSMVVYALIMVPSAQIAAITLVISIFDLIAVLYFNRRGKIIVAGLIITFLAEAGVMGAALGDIGQRGGVDIATLPFLALLVQGIIVGGSTLPSKSVFIMFITNMAFMLFLFFGMPHTHVLDQYLASSYVLRNMLCIFSTVYLLATFTTFIWVRSTNSSIRRADRAEDLAHLQHAIALANQHAVEQKAALEQGVHEIVQSISQISNYPERELNVDRRQVLWQIVVALDNLRKRLFNTRYEANQLKRTQAAIAQLVILLERGQVTHWEQTGTSIDEVALRLKHGRMTDKLSSFSGLSSSDELKATLQHALQMLNE